MNNILLVSGTRPEIIKLAPVYHALRAGDGVRVQWAHTGQHGDMAQQIMSCFDIVPDIVLRRQGATLSEFSIGCRGQLDAVMTRQPWSAVVVQGDTESAFLGALSAFYNRIPVAHVEAGLRTYNLQRPFPEEGLRQMIGRLTRPTGRVRPSSRRASPIATFMSPVTPLSTRSSGAAATRASSAAPPAGATCW